MLGSCSYLGRGRRRGKGGGRGRGSGRIRVRVRIRVRIRVRVRVQVSALRRVPRHSVVEGLAVGHRAGDPLLVLGRPPEQRGVHAPA